MRVEVNEDTLASIRNPALRSYAEQYVRIVQDFMEKVRQSGIEIDSGGEDGQFEARVAALRKKGALVRNDSKSIYTKRISSACQACQTGVGSATFFISLKCHRDCFYCFNPNQEGYEYFREHTRDTVAELQTLRASRARVRHLALTGGEPLLHKEEALRFFQEARQGFPGVYTRLYTCGDHVDRQTLQALKDAGMDEIRYSIRMQDLAKGQRHTYDQIALAREYIPHVMVEMPVLPGRLEEMKEVLTELERLEIFGINLLEFCFPLHNAEVFRQHGYRIKARPFRVLYNYWYAGGLPVAGSEMECLDLVEFALDAGLNLGVHYCSLENKHSGQVYQQNSIRPLPKTMYFSQTDYFLKSAKVFGEDIASVQRFFQKAGYKHYEVNEAYNYLEFHVSQIRSLKKFDIEIGLSSNIFETRDGERYIRELKVDGTTPQTFRLSVDV
ncbi:MAG: radical SAM protein [Chloroflexi bacterium]|nr:radical SAM protein [Chloroflexota bacterium]